MGDIDEDLALALCLQDEFNIQDPWMGEMKEGRFTPGQTGETANIAIGGSVDTEMSLADPRWETLDPNPDIRTLFIQFNDRFFSRKLAGVEVKWSPRMTLCAGVCSYEGHGGLCSVRLSQPLLKLRPRKDLIETLLHEMIHAYLFVTANNRDHDAHGPEFHKHMHRINKETGCSISVYHSFHDEVDHHHQHWWRCDGPCRARRPYFGYVKRAMNRAPHPRDTWWADHRLACGGTFSKVKEPEDYGKKKGKAPKNTSPVKPKGVRDIRSVFGSIKDKKHTEEGGSGTKSAGHPVPPTVMGDGQSTAPAFAGRGFTTGWHGKPGSVVEGAPPPAQSGRRAHPPSPPPPLPSTSIRSSSPPGKVTRFSGGGVVLGGAGKALGDPLRVVRRLPGVGVITCERPLTCKAGITASMSDTETVDASEGGRKRNFTDESSDSDTDSILRKLSETKRKRYEPPKEVKRNSIGVGLNRSMILADSLLTTSPGSIRKVPGFQSVCAKNSQPPEFLRKDPKLIEQEREWVTKRGRRKPISKSKGGRPTVKHTSNTSLNNPLAKSATNRKANKTSSLEGSGPSSGTDSESRIVRGKTTTGHGKPQWNLAVNRNRRAILGDSDDSDSDSELRPLISVHSKNKQPLPNTDVRAPASQADSASVRVRDTPVAPPNVGVALPGEDPLQECPVCARQVLASVMNIHLDGCLSGL